MPFNIHEFRANGLKLGGARPNQFEVTIHTPFSKTEALKRLTFTCRAASSPPAIGEEVPVYYFGRAIKLAGDRVFPDWDITVMNDEDFVVRNLFEDWSNRINALVSNRMNPNVFPMDYRVSGFVRQFGKTGNIIREYELEALWPKVVDAMPLDWAAQNQIQEFNVTLAYDLWRPAGAVSANNQTFSPVLPPDAEGAASSDNAPAPRLVSTQL